MEHKPHSELVAHWTRDEVQALLDSEFEPDSTDVSSVFQAYIDLVEQLETVQTGRYLLRVIDSETGEPVDGNEIESAPWGHNTTLYFTADYPRVVRVEVVALDSFPAMSPEGAGTKGAASRLAGASASRSAPPSPQDRGVQPHPLPEDSNQERKPE